MASSYKTSHLGLSRWMGEDKPKRADFVADNEILDAAVYGHVSDSDIHVTAEEKEKWNSGSGIITGIYAGNGTDSQTISLGFKPIFLAVFAMDKQPSFTIKVTGLNVCYTGFATSEGGSLGMVVNSSGFTVRMVMSTPSDTLYYRLNESGVQYGYIAVKPQ